MGEVLSELSSGYYLERDPDVLVLRRDDASLAAAFSSRGAMPEAGFDEKEEYAQHRRRILFVRQTYPGTWQSGRMRWS